MGVESVDGLLVMSRKDSKIRKCDVNLFMHNGHNSDRLFKSLFLSADWPVKISLLMLERVKAENVSKQNTEQVFNPFFSHLYYHLKLHRQVAEH